MEGVREPMPHSCNPKAWALCSIHDAAWHMLKTITTQLQIILLKGYLFFLWTDCNLEVMQSVYVTSFLPYQVKPSYHFCPPSSLGFKMRQRHIIVEPTGTSGNCPHLIESIPCENPVCYKWIISEGVCLPYNGICGQGNRVQHAVCKNYKGMWYKLHFI